MVVQPVIAPGKRGDDAESRLVIVGARGRTVAVPFRNRQKPGLGAIEERIVLQDTSGDGEVPDCVDHLLAVDVHLTPQSGGSLIVRIALRLRHYVAGEPGLDRRAS